MKSVCAFAIISLALCGTNSVDAEINVPTHLAVMAETPAPPDEVAGLTAEVLAGLKFRGLGPALMSGRICDFAVDPAHPHRYFAAVCSGGLWKTENAGTTWTPVFDDQASYSIGCVTLDPRNSSVVWVGSGENNSQRSVAWGDGVYRSRDGGRNWENVGLKESEHIGEIVVDPRDSDTVCVAAQGPLWRSGGDRGLYKTTDGGATWNRVLHISDDTGVNEVHMDPRDPDVLYASAYQRRRHVWTLINGGPESAVYKSTDAGATWRKLEKGLPEVDKGRIGMCVSPANPDFVYAIVEAADGKGGVFRSIDRGETWDKRNDFMSSSPQYYNELVCDPLDPDRVYIPETFMRVTNDGGKTITRHPRDFRHVDDHALWINPRNPDHLLVGSDGGIYESYDRGGNWRYTQNLPVTQFYRVAVDNSEPFYFIYGGTQDNNTIGGPSRTINPGGIANEDWFITVGGDGFETAVDPEDPNIVYSQWQHGGLVRFDRRSGEIIDIKPREAPGEEPYRWNWDSPLIISPHHPHRLYFGANRLFRSDDRGDTWKVVTGDLSRGIDRNALEVMGRVQNVDAVAKNRSTSIYGNTVSLSESPLVEGLIYVGTDDGLIHVTENGGADWRKSGVFPTVPDVTYVSALLTSRHVPDRVYAAFDNHKKGDFKPYVLRSDDRGQTWASIAGDLPERDVVYTLGEDHEKPDLLFAGTEFGVYATLDGGTKWLRLKGGIPTISVRDLEIQRRENDLVLGTFGRGFYVLDDYSPLRTLSAELPARDAVLFPVKDARAYMETNRLADPAGKATQGASYYLAPNPPFGAVFTYHLKEKLKTRKEQRKDAEKNAEKTGKPYRYPPIEELRAEDEERDPGVILVVSNSAGDIVRRVPGPRDKGIHRVSWDLRHPSAEPTELKPSSDRPPWISQPVGPMAAPGKYTVALMRDVDGEMTPLTEAQSFNVVPLSRATLPAVDRDEKAGFDGKVARLQRAVAGAIRAAGEAENRIAHLRKAFVDTPGADRARLVELQGIGNRLTAILTVLRGDRTLAGREEPAPPSIYERVENVVGSQWYTSSGPTGTQRDAYRYAGEAFTQSLADLRKLFGDLTALEAKLESDGAPWTPGRLPEWQIE